MCPDPEHWPELTVKCGGSGPVAVDRGVTVVVSRQLLPGLQSVLAVAVVQGVLRSFAQ